MTRLDLQIAGWSARRQHKNGKYYIKARAGADVCCPGSSFDAALAAVVLPAS